MTARCRDCGDVLTDLLVVMTPKTLDVEGICTTCGNERAPALAGSWSVEDFMLPDEEEYEGQLLLPRG